MEGPRYGWFGDDFTGATDTLATIAGRGHRAFLFLDVPDEARLRLAGPLDAIGIASAARSLRADALRAAVAPAGRFFRECGVRLLHYKCCSTFDSAPETGNIAAALEALSGFAEGPALILGGQPSLGRTCAFSNLFAAADGTVHRLERHPTMSRHPATPMGEADLRRHLAALGLDGIEAVHWPEMENAVDLQNRIAALAGARAILVDALTQTHVIDFGTALRSFLQPVLAVGASSVAEAFFPETTPTPISDDHDETGPVLALAGSLSPTTRRQIEAATAYERIEMAVQALATSEAYHAEIRARTTRLLGEGRNVLLTTIPANAGPPTSADGTLALRSAALVNAILEQAPVRRLIAAGGDTSSHVAQALGIWGLSYIRRAAPGVSVCRSRSDRPERDGMPLMLKGGQMGDAGLFDRFAERRSQ